MEKIDLEQIQKDTKEIYEISSEISLLQEELESLLIVIDRYSSRYQKGKIPKDIFKINEKKLKEESAGKIKRINLLVQNGLNLLGRIEKSIQIEEIEEGKKDADNKKD